MKIIATGGITVLNTPISTARPLEIILQPGEQITIAGPNGIEIYKTINDRIDHKPPIHSTTDGSDEQEVVISSRPYRI